MTKTSMPPAQFEPATPVSKWPQTPMLDCVTTGIGLCILFLLSGFGGLVVGMLVPGTQDCGFEPSLSRRIFG
jgi:hypothetical protein